MLSFISFYNDFIEEITEMNLNLSHRELTNHIKSKGWFFDRHAGDHEIYKHKEHKDHIAIPKHKNGLSTGVVHKILKKIA